MAVKRATIHDVANMADVSIATVSRVVHMQEGVSASTRKRVQEAIGTLRYTPNESGRALANRKHDTLGFVVPGLSGPFFGDIVEGCSEFALSDQKAVLVLSTHLLPGVDKQVISLVGRVDGLAILGGTVSNHLLGQVKHLGKPMVLVSQHPELDIPTVRVDNSTPTRELVRHLVHHHGYRDLVFAGSVTGSPDAEDRWQAFCTVLLDAGITPPFEPIPSRFEYSAGPELAEVLLHRDRLPQAVVCGNDQIAVGLIAALRNRGVQVPNDVAVTGWDDIDIAAHLVPSLTTIQQPTHELGTLAVRTLLDQINGLSVETETVLPAALVIRESCGCPPAAHT